MFHINLKNRRLACGLSQKQVADRLRITPQSVSKWEKGDALPSIQYLPMLADCLNCDINAFFAPIPEESKNVGAILDLLGLMHEAVYGDTKSFDDITAYEKEHPQSLDATVAFCRALCEHKTVKPKALQGTLGCSDTEARAILRLLASGEALERLDDEDMYFVVQDATDGLVILFKFCQTLLEMSDREPDAFLSSFKSKL